MSDRYDLRTVADGACDAWGDAPKSHQRLLRDCADALLQAADDVVRLEAAVASLRQEAEEFRALFDLQWARTQEAERLYVAAHPRPACPHGYKPDLGKLIGWLLEFYRYVEAEPCGCPDEWATSKPLQCERCRLLGKYPNPLEDLKVQLAEAKRESEAAINRVLDIEREIWYVECQFPECRFWPSRG